MLASAVGPVLRPIQYLSSLCSNDRFDGKMRALSCGVRLVYLNACLCVPCIAGRGGGEEVAALRRDTSCALQRVLPPETHL